MFNASVTEVVREIIRTEIAGVEDNYFAGHRVPVAGTPALNTWEFSSLFAVLDELSGIPIAAISCVSALGLFPRLHKFGDESGPAGLMRGTDASARVAVEILVEPHVVTEMRVGLKLLDVAEDGAPAGRIPQEYALQTTGQLLGRL